MTDTTARSTIEGFLNAFAANDVDEMLGYCSPGVRSIDYSANASGIRGEYEGHAGIREQLVRFDSVLEATSFSVDEVVGSGSTWVARTRLGLKSKVTGESYTGPLLIVYEVDEGVITKMETYPTEPESLYIA